MKLLFDQNVSYRLIHLLQDLYPDSEHVRESNLDRSSDDEVRKFAREHDFIIVSKDSDFYANAILEGAPPKVIWIRRGNCSTKAIADLLREKSVLVRRFVRSESSAFLVVD